MSDLQIFINGRATEVRTGTSVAAAVLQSGHAMFRKSVSGEPRGALCGMGICYECRVTINGAAHARSCQILCAPQMRIETT